MKGTPARILETRHWSDERLCRLIERFHAAGPAEGELARARDALERTLGSDFHELLAEPASGVRVMPQPPTAKPERPVFEERVFVERPRVVSAELIEPQGFWSNPTVSRALAAFSTAAVAALLWASVQRSEAPLASAPQPVEVHRRETPRSVGPAPDPGGLAGRSEPEPAALARTADAESTPRPAARPRVVPVPSARARANAADTGGKLNINSIPYSKVVLDGRPLGDTPRVEVMVAAGPHTVLFVHPELGRIQREVYVDSGSTVLAAVRFD